MTSSIDQGSFSLIGMKTSPSSVSINGHPPTIEVNEKSSLINLGGLPLTDITYNVLGLDSILTNVDVIHPTSLQPGLKNNIIISYDDRISYR